MPKDLSNLKPAKGSVRTKTRRRGRGQGSGLGGTAGRGHKGQQSRSGYKRRRWFEGGQMPIHRRLPKRGFTNIWREEYQVVNIRDLDLLDAGIDDITAVTLAERGLIKNSSKPVKLLAIGEVSRALKVNLSAISAGARTKIEAAGGTVEVPEPAPKRGKYAKRSERMKVEE
jgi:large subunit ribosomal protein L15